MKTTKRRVNLFFDNATYKRLYFIAYDANCSVIEYVRKLVDTNIDDKLHGAKQITIAFDEESND